MEESSHDSLRAVLFPDCLAGEGEGLIHDADVRVLRQIISDQGGDGEDDSDTPLGASGLVAVPGTCLPTESYHRSPASTRACRYHAALRMSPASILSLAVNLNRDTRAVSR